MSDAWNALKAHAWVLGLLAFFVLFLIYVIFYLIGGATWTTATPNNCIADNNCYCENAPSSLSTGLVNQPANTWSGLAPVLLGLVILGILSYARSHNANPMTQPSFYSWLYAALVVFLGPGSMAFHGSLTAIGGWLDQFSMSLFVTFVLLYDIFRFTKWDTLPNGKTYFTIAYAIVNVALGVPLLIGNYTDMGMFGTLAFGIPAGIAILMQLIIGAVTVFSSGSVWGVRRGQFTPGSLEWLWLIGAFLSFMIGFVIWLISDTGGTWCNPNSALQGHMFWHVLAMGFTPFFLFFFLRSERRT
ncbi:MAG: ceramidase domain-containing protein [Chloroflexi bacterium]|nr:ceramidase domain-containing protein [Chloroflexota bacterium]